MTRSARMRIAPSLLAIALLCATLAPPAWADGAGAISGAVRNGTSGGGAPAGLGVTLRVFRGMEEQPPRTAVTDAEGRFRFEGLDVGDDWIYLAWVTYADVVYASGPLSLAAEEPVQQIVLSVYETTTDARIARVGRAHVFVTAAADGLAVTELYVFENATDRTYVGVDELDGRRWTARFELPAASRDLVLDDGALGARFLSIEGGFVDTEPHWPGSTQVLYSYVVDCPAGVCDLSRTIAHPIADMNVLVSEVGAEIESELLAFQGTREAQGGSYLNYAAHELPAGVRIDLIVRFSGTSAAPAAWAQLGSSGLPWMILITVLSALPLIYPFWRRRVAAAARREP
ncbi:MAG: carboxypeptidase regulatory-like domain-containing protein [Anaerolineae bacterium]|nr:carboxypeptidase regulatory-like domain-containing protein [Anaerolineae bacterium]